MSKSFQSDENKTNNWLLTQFNIYYNGENKLDFSGKKYYEWEVLNIFHKRKINLCIYFINNKNVKSF